MAKFLYEVSLNMGKSNKNYSKFLNNVTELNAKSPDFAGINNICIIAHHMDAETIHSLCTDGFKRSASDVSVEEITKKTLLDPTGHHRIYTDLIENYFLPHGKYPNLS